MLTWDSMLGIYHLMDPLLLDLHVVPSLELLEETFWIPIWVAEDTEHSRSGERWK